ncbi:MAG TPA: hypothetical protein VFS05_13620 [Gemmatimonadaceae bacterium]|nr:hypothetical protein [Gemmatimonadaceae bacterium]
MHLGRDLLDRLLVDEDDDPMGMVDGVVIELREGRQPRVTWIEVGGTTPARRLPWPLRPILTAMARRWGVGCGAPYRIPWSAVRDVHREITVAREADETPARAWEERIAERVIGRIPGA